MGKTYIKIDKSAIYFPTYYSESWLDRRKHNNPDRPTACADLENEVNAFNAQYGRTCDSGYGAQCYS